MYDPNAIRTDVFDVAACAIPKNLLLTFPLWTKYSALDITMHDIFIMGGFNTSAHLNCDADHSLKESCPFFSM